MDILHCEFVYHCPKTWENLLRTENPGVRYCSACDKGVHLCSTQAELDRAVQAGKCVAVRGSGTGKNEDSASTMPGLKPATRKSAHAGDGEIMTVGVVSLPYFYQETDPSKEDT